MYFEQHIFVCENSRDSGRECCAHKNATEMRGKLKQLVKEELRTKGVRKRVRVNKAGCLDRCEEGPVLVVYPEGRWFRIPNEGDIPRFVEHYILNQSEEEIADLALSDVHPAERARNP